MSRRQRVEAEQAVIRTARAWRSTRSGIGNLDERYRANCDLADALQALDALEAGEITDTSGPHVYGSPETSAAAASLSGPLAGTLRRAIIDEIRCTPDALKGLTEDELEVRLKRSHSSVSSAVNHLATVINWLQDSGYRRVTRGGRDAIIWGLTPDTRTRAGRT